MNARRVGLALAFVLLFIPGRAPRTTKNREARSAAFSSPTRAARRVSRNCRPPSRCCTRSGTGRPKKRSAMCWHTIGNARSRTGASPRYSCRIRSRHRSEREAGRVRTGRDRRGGACSAENATRARLHRGSRVRITRISRAARKGRDRRGAEGVRRARSDVTPMTTRRRFLRAVYRRDAIAGRPDLCGVPQGRRDSREECSSNILITRVWRTT